MCGCTKSGRSTLSGQRNYTRGILPLTPHITYLVPRNSHLIEKKFANTPEPGAAGATETFLFIRLAAKKNGHFKRGTFPLVRGDTEK